MSLASWTRLQQLEQNIEARFTNNCTTGNCPTPGRLHLLFAHYAQRPVVDTVMNAWPWPTLAAYERAEEARYANAYKDFLGARLLWKEIAGVQLTNLPNLRLPVARTAADGGTLIHLNSASATGRVHVDTDSPLVADAETYHPPRRRLCLSVPNLAGSHLDVDAPRAGGRITGQLLYPEPSNDPRLRLFAVMPGFNFTLGGATVGATDPWGERPDAAANNLRALRETTTPLELGSVRSYLYQGTTYYGIQRTRGGASTRALGTTHATQLGQSRSQLFRAVSGIEGDTGSLNSYDGTKISWGINQWNRTELWQILAFISDFYPDAFKKCFGWFGIGVRYASRAATWSTGGTYRDVTVYRIPCCGTRTRTAIDAVLLSTSDENGLQRVATATALNQRLDTKSYAMHYVFAAAGEDASIQEAQAQWMSFRITSLNPAGKTLDTVTNEFLVNLGSSVSPTARITMARNTLGAAGPGLLGRPFSDADAERAWVDWPTRCGAAVPPPRVRPNPNANAHP